MNRLSSAEFRIKYAKLTEPTVVTVLGHDIGEWIPYRGQRVDETTAGNGIGAARPAPKPAKRHSSVATEAP